MTRRLPVFDVLHGAVLVDASGQQERDRKSGFRMDSVLEGVQTRRVVLLVDLGAWSQRQRQFFVNFSTKIAILTKVNITIIF
jgi:flagellar biosynthesis GTPase FlhF